MLDVDQAMDVATQLIVLIGGLTALLGGGVIALKRWVRKTVSEPLMEQVQPNGGRQETTRTIVEEIADKADALTNLTAQVVRRVEEIEQNREADALKIQQALTQAQSALTVATHTGDRLDRMLERQERRDGG